MLACWVSANLEVRRGVLGDSIDLSPVLGVRRLLVTGEVEALGLTNVCRPRVVVGFVAAVEPRRVDARVELETNVDGEEARLEVRVESSVEEDDGRVMPRMEVEERVESRAEERVDPRVEKRVELRVETRVDGRVAPRVELLVELRVEPLEEVRSDGAVLRLAEALEEQNRMKLVSIGTCLASTFVLRILC